MGINNNFVFQCLIKRYVNTLGMGLNDNFVFQCLKESYVKALGVGIGFELKRVEFHLGCGGGLRTGEITRDTQVYVDGALEDDWIFQETMLDQIHCVAVAVKKSLDVDNKGQDSGENPTTVSSQYFNPILTYLAKIVCTYATLEKIFGMNHEMIKYLKESRLLVFAQYFFFIYFLINDFA